jgi:hypothetical protein
MWIHRPPRSSAESPAVVFVCPPLGGSASTSLLPGHIGQLLSRPEPFRGQQSHPNPLSVRIKPRATSQNQNPQISGSIARPAAPAASFKSPLSGVTRLYHRLPTRQVAPILSTKIRQVPQTVINFYREYVLLLFFCHQLAFPLLQT